MPSLHAFAAIAAAVIHCQDHQNEEQCVAVPSQDCHWCQPGRCRPATAPCPCPFNFSGNFYSIDTLDVMNLVPINSSATTVSYLNGTTGVITPTIMTYLPDGQVSMKVPNSSSPKMGFASSSFGHTRISWSGSTPETTDTWRNGSLPLPNFPFPISWNQTLFHSSQQTIQGYPLYTITAKTDGSMDYYVHSVNKTFDDTTAVSKAASGNEQLLDIYFSDTNTTLSGKMQCRVVPHSPSCGSPTFVWEGAGGLAWELGGTPPPNPLPPIDKCNQAYTKDGCMKGVKEEQCTWCVSTDGVDKLCFPKDHAPSSKTWKCTTWVLWWRWAFLPSHVCILFVQGHPCLVRL